MIPRDVLEVIREIVLRETRYLRHYVGKVTSNTDPLREGRVLVQVPMLGWSSDSVAPWCRPRDKHAMIVPSEGEWVEVYFVDGNPSRAVYQGIASEMKGSLPDEYDGSATTAVLFQDKGTGDSIVYDGAAKKLKQDAGEINLNGGSKAFVTWDELNTALQSMLAAINANFALKLDTAGTPGTTTLDISAAKTTTVKTGG